MYNPDKFIDIDIFKGIPLFQSLEKYNCVVESVARTASYQKGGNYDVNKNEASFWFNPDRIRETPLPHCYPNILPIQYDPRISLTTHIANHMSILIIETLYKNRKDILIEDLCCGMGNMVFYLSKLGFKEFNMVDNFSQLPKELFERMMKAGGINYYLNDMSIRSHVTNLIAYVNYPKRNSMAEEILPLEVLMSYVPILPGNNNLHIDNDKFFEMFTCLAKDPNKLLYVYCKNYKYDDFANTLQQIKL